MKFVTGALVGLAAQDVWAGGAVWAALWALENTGHRIARAWTRPVAARQPWPAEENVS